MKFGIQEDQSFSFLDIKFQYFLYKMGELFPLQMVGFHSLHNMLRWMYH